MDTSDRHYPSIRWKDSGSLCNFARLVLATGAASSALIATACQAPDASKKEPAAFVQQTTVVTVTTSAEAASTRVQAESTPSARRGKQAVGDPSRCLASQLKLRIDSTQGGAGSQWSTVKLTNVGGQCTMFGYPGVSFINAAGNQVGAPADRQAADHHESVILTPGGSAQFTIRMSNAMAYNKSDCAPTRSVTALKIYPPNDKGFVTTPITTVACSNPKVHTFTVSAIHA